MPFSPHSTIWPQDLILDLIHRAEQGRPAVAELSSKREAILFQWAVKNYKKSRRVGGDIFTRVEGTSLALYRKPEIKTKEDQ